MRVKNSCQLSANQRLQEEKRENCRIHMQAIIKLCFQGGILTFSILFLLSNTDSDTKAFFYIFIQVERFVIIVQLFIIQTGFYLNFI